MIHSSIHRGIVASPDILCPINYQLHHCSELFFFSLASSPWNRKTIRRLEKKIGKTHMCRCALSLLFSNNVSTDTPPKTRKKIIMEVTQSVRHNIPTIPIPLTVSLCQDWIFEVRDETLHWLYVIDSKCDEDDSQPHIRENKTPATVLHRILIKSNCFVNHCSIHRNA